MADRKTFNWTDPHHDLPFSPATRIGDTLYISGQVGVERATRSVVPGGIGPQTRRALQNLEEVLELAGVTLQNVAKVNVFLTEMSDFEAFNAAYREFFPTDPPSRTTVGTSGLSKPEMLIEIEAIATAV